MMPWESWNARDAALLRIGYSWQNKGMNRQRNADRQRRLSTNPLNQANGMRKIVIGITGALPLVCGG